MTDARTIVRRIVFAIIALAMAILLWRAILFGVGAIVALVLVVIGYQELAVRRAASRFRSAYRSLGKDLLLVYSNSPHWQSYIETHWIPRWGTRAVVLNWSERTAWMRRQPEVALFHSLATHREYNPLAIVMPSRGRPVVVRFWKAFRDHKHGRDVRLKQREAELERLLALDP